MLSKCNEPKKPQKQPDQVRDYPQLSERFNGTVSLQTIAGIIISVSPSFETLTGWSAVELLEHNCRFLIHPVDLPLAMEYIQQLHNGQQRASIRLRLLHKSGEYRPVEVISRTEVINAGVQYTWTFTRDLMGDEQPSCQYYPTTGERKHIQSVVGLIRVATFRAASPLSNIHLTTYSLAKQNTDPVVKTAVERIERYAQELSQLLDRVLMIAEFDTDWANFSGTSVKLNRLVQYVKANLTPVAEARKVALTVELADDSLLVRGNEFQLYRAIYELVTNAIQNTPEYGAVTVRVFQRDSDGIIEIRDTGVGIATELIPHLFEQYCHISQTSAVPGNMGLGLPFAKRITERFGGTISVVSTSDGSTFTMTVPLF
jgi:PAS domain S-box-containing protein